MLVKTSHIRAVLDPPSDLLFCKNKLHLHVTTGRVCWEISGTQQHFPAPITPLSWSCLELELAFFGMDLPFCAQAPLQSGVTTTAPKFWVWGEGWGCAKAWLGSLGHWKCTRQRWGQTMGDCAEISRIWASFQPPAEAGWWRWANRIINHHSKKKTYLEEFVRGNKSKRTHGGFFLGFFSSSHQREKCVMNVSCLKHWAGFIKGS